jgi:hypothetical protein
MVEKFLKIDFKLTDDQMGSTVSLDDEGEGEDDDEEDDDDHARPL